MEASLAIVRTAETSERQGRLCERTCKVYLDRIGQACESLKLRFLIKNTMLKNVV